ncbi:hypothetical protein pb186bvf_019426 [Paramecium bursaria]
MLYYNFMKQTYWILEIILLFRNSFQQSSIIIFNKIDISIPLYSQQINSKFCIISNNPQRTLKDKIQYFKILLYKRSQILRDNRIYKNYTNRRKLFYEFDLFFCDQRIYTRLGVLNQKKLIQQIEQDKLINAQNFIDFVVPNTITIKWDVINLDDKEYVQLEQEIKKRSLYFKGQVGHLTNIKIYCLESENKFQTQFCNIQNQMIAQYIQKLGYLKILIQSGQNYLPSYLFVELLSRCKNLLKEFQVRKTKTHRIKITINLTINQKELERYFRH